MEAKQIEPKNFIESVHKMLASVDKSYFPLAIHQSISSTEGVSYSQEFNLSGQAYPRKLPKLEVGVRRKITFPLTYVEPSVEAILKLKPEETIEGFLCFSYQDNKNENTKNKYWLSTTDFHTVSSGELITTDQKKVLKQEVDSQVTGMPLEKAVTRYFVDIMKSKLSR